jgi:hypothetical protein
MIKAIETQYKGYCFRSRLEARWAVFFDALGIEWEYEPEGFELSDGTWYLPDFHLPGREWWIEIKPVLPTGDELSKCRQLCGPTRQRVYLVIGIPGKEKIYSFHWLDDHVEHGYENTAGFGEFTTGKWALAMSLSAKQSEPLDALDGMFCVFPEMRGLFTRNTPRIRAAIKRARGARFEHGETPRARARR